jgi:hypothetical protein
MSRWMARLEILVLSYVYEVFLSVGTLDCFEMVVYPGPGLLVLIHRHPLILTGVLLVLARHP